jgi:iron complex transport system ATP-binding protein
LVAINARNLNISYGDRPIVPNLSLSLETGKVTALIGPNGSGKSTVLRTLARLLKPQQGAIYLHGRDIATMPTRTIARQLAMLPQSPDIPAGITVWEAIAYGRYPHRSLFRGLSHNDQAAMDWALEVTGLTSLRDRLMDTLSGGERQRAWIAMALAQETQVLLLDEPTTFLDIRHQIDILALVRTLNRERKITVGWVLHDLNQAAAYSDHILMLRSGELIASGPPAEVMTPENIFAGFGVEMMVIPHPLTGTPTCFPSELGILEEMQEVES